MIPLILFTGHTPVCNLFLARGQARLMSLMRLSVESFNTSIHTLIVSLIIRDFGVPSKPYDIMRAIVLHLP